jgi:nucleoside-diphosphate-sugar epimerase
MKTLVMGGSKFVGLHLVYELMRQGHDVTVFNRGKTEVKFSEGVKCLYGDRYSSTQMGSLLQGHNFEAIFDTSAYLFGTPLNPRAYEGEMKIWRGLFSETLKHLVFISSNVVYAETDFYPITEESPFNRSTEANMPGGQDAMNYRLNKLKCEDELRKVFKEEGFPATILRASWVYGPENYRYFREASYFVRLEDGRRIIVPGKGHLIHQCGHVDDLARAFVCVLGNQRALGESYNVTGEEFFTINGFISTAARVVGVEPRMVHIDYKILDQMQKAVSIFQSLLAHERSSFLSIEKAKKHLNWKPQYDLESGLRQTYQWFRKAGRDWYKEHGAEWAGQAKVFDFSFEDEVLARYG